MLKWCEQRGYIEEQPFKNLKFDNYGTPRERFIIFSKQQLKDLFALDMHHEDRLLLSILVVSCHRSASGGDEGLPPTGHGAHLRL
jgi:hypothetical protein